MDFASKEDLQTFLAQWLVEHGYSVFRGVQCPGGEAIDILTPEYAIQCHQYLTETVLSEAAEHCRTYRSHFPDQQPVIAGLTPLENSTLAPLKEQVQTAGIDIWFLDQIRPLMDYYAQLEQRAIQQKTGRYQWGHVLLGFILAVGIAGILVGSFAIARLILTRFEAQAQLTLAEQAEWEVLHKAARVWDLATAQESLDKLAESPNVCLREFAERFQNTLDERGAEGFRDINPIKRSLNDQKGCDLEITPFDFSP